MTATIAELEAAIQKQGAAFMASKRRLAAALGPAMPKAGAEDIFISSAFEFDVAHTLEEAQKDGRYFDLPQPLDKATAMKIAEPLEEADRVHTQTINAMAEREALLLTKDQSHVPTYYWLGREFTINPANETITYKDTGEVYAFQFDGKSVGLHETSGKQR